MQKKYSKHIVFIFAFVIVFLIAGHLTTYAVTTTKASLQNQIDANNQQISDLNKKIAEYQAQLAKVGADKKTLQAAISSLTIQRSKIETQISVTQRQIDTTNLQIKQLGSDIFNTQQTIVESKTAIGQYLQNLQTADDQSFWEQLLSAGTLDAAWNDSEAIVQIQYAIQDKVHTLQTQEAKLTDSQKASKQKQDVLTSQKKSLTSQQTTLIAAKNAKAQLLVETSAQESKYQALIAAAKAELASFSSFAKNSGSSGLLTDQTSCDSWGCYYNQRDVAWGNDALNNTTYKLSNAGCLITSMAMVMTHYGYTDVTPQTINSNPDNFATYYPAYLLMMIYVDGVTAVRKSATIDATLATGNPVVVGMHVFGGSHFIVLVSGKKGNYLMRDPYFPNAKDVNFSDRYTLADIYEVHKVVIN